MTSIHNTVIGKDILEMLMFSLYPDAETIYREYLQNACDSIKEAVIQGVLSKEQGQVSVDIDKFHNVVTIADNGTGIPTDLVEQRLKDIARSKKDYESSAGFYGIGRLVGAGYCKTLTFKTSVTGENVASEMIFDVEKIREILENTEDTSSAAEVIDAVTTFNNTTPEDPDKHYFVVILNDILPEYADDLLDEEKIHKYLVQVAPIPYLAEFKNNLIQPNITSTNNKILKYYQDLNIISISLNEIEDIRKPYSTIVDGTGEPIDKLRFFSLTDPKYDDLAWGWYAITTFEKAIPANDPDTTKPVLTRGLRLRAHNIQIGDEKVLNKYFKQVRSNLYFNGEIHIINSGIKPTTDRSDLAPTPIAIALKKQLEIFFNTELQQNYQTANKIKKELERYQDAEKEIQEFRNKKSVIGISDENKATKLTDALQRKQQAQNEFQKLQSKKESLPPGVQDMLEVYQKKFDVFNKNAVEDNPSVNNDHRGHCKNAEIPPRPTETEEIKKLEPTYGVEKIDMLRRIFSIIDNRYKKKYETIINSIKTSVINDLKK